MAFFRINCHVSCMIMKNHSMGISGYDRMVEHGIYGLVSGLLHRPYNKTELCKGIYANNSSSLSYAILFHSFIQITTAGPTKNVCPMLRETNVRFIELKTPRSSIKIYWRHTQIHRRHANVTCRLVYVHIHLCVFAISIHWILNKWRSATTERLRLQRRHQQITIWVYLRRLSVFILLNELTRFYFQFSCKQVSECSQSVSYKCCVISDISMCISFLH